jgi:DnaJ-class molecular chaperone
MGNVAYRLTGDPPASISGLDSLGRGFADVFADDVLVDFPSVATVLDRMRGAFVDDGSGAPLSADVPLSARQAFAGATVPIELPVRCTCRDCGGTGEWLQAPCPHCVGTGVELRQHQVLVSVPSRVTDGTRLRLVLAPRRHPATRIELRVAIR